MIFFRIKNWMKHQHYKDRRPPWIKLHNSLFDDYEFQQLTDIQRWHLVAIWLLASRSNRFHEDGDPLLPEDEKYLTRQTGTSGKIDLKPLYSAGFIVRYQDDSNTQAKCSPETEAYKEETEGEAEVFSPDVMTKLWNENTNGCDIPKVLRLTTERRKKCIARITSLSLTEEKWRGVITGIYASEFLTGKNDRKWVANFDWIIRNDDNIVKVVEGGYR